MYLLGIKFKLVTDCLALKETIDKKDLTPRVARWVMMMEEFNYVIEHRNGSRIPHADALSRHPYVLYAVEDDIRRWSEKFSTSQRKNLISDFFLFYFST